MIGPIDEDPASQEAQVGLERDNDDERRLKRRQQNRLYLENHPDQNAVTRRRWVDANRDQVRDYDGQWRKENLERTRELNRESARGAVLRMKKQAELRASARERAKRWRESHLDEVREYQARWVKRNPEKVRGYYSDYYRTHRDEVNERAAARRDADSEPMKRARKAWVERNKLRLVELQRERRKDPEAYRALLEANAAARRLKRRLQTAGLPPKQLRPATAAERRAHERDAAAYFNDPELPEHVRQSMVFTEALTTHMRVHATEMREFSEAYANTRLRMGLPPIESDGAIYARGVEIVLRDLRDTDLLTSGDVAGAVRSSMAILSREMREQQSARLVKSLVAHVNHNRDRLGVEAEIENRARARRGLASVRLDALLVQIALQEVAERVPMSQLTRADVKNAARAARARIVTPPEGCANGESLSTVNSESRQAKRVLNDD